MTPIELRTHAQRIYGVLIRERRRREAVYPAGHAKRDAALAEIDAAVASLRALKVFGDLHTEEPPEQVTLFDGEALPAPGRRGGY